MALAIVYLRQDATTLLLGNILFCLCVLDGILILTFANLVPDEQWAKIFWLALVLTFTSVGYAPLVTWNGTRSRTTQKLWSVYMAKILSIVIAVSIVDDGDAAFGLVWAVTVLYLLETLLLLVVLVRSSAAQKNLVWKAVSSRRAHLEQTAAGVESVFRALSDAVDSDQLAATSGGAAAAGGEGTAPGGLVTVGSRTGPHVTKALDKLSELVYREDMKRATHLSLNQTHFNKLVAGVLVIASLAFGFEMAKIVTRQEAMFTEGDIEGMRAATADNADRLLSTRVHAANKVLIVVLDGLRYDYAHEFEFWNNGTYAAQCDPATCVADADVALLEITNQLPSMSVPNWLTIVSGAPPEFTGIIGNLLAPDTIFETIYSSAKSANVMRMVTGTPWFAAIIARTLPFLRGDGTIDAGFDTAETTLPTSAPADRERTKVGLTAVRATDDPYHLMLVHYSDIDSQGHSFGVTPAFNKAGTYVSAIREKADSVRQIMEEIDDDTIVLAVSDHGHIDHGGHGSIQRELRRVPLFVYKRGSGIKATVDAFTADAANAGRAYTNLDIAPTVSALLGVSVPGQALGGLIEPLVNAFVPAGNVSAHWRDLWAQKLALIHTFDAAYGVETATPLPAADRCALEMEDGGGPGCRVSHDALVARYYEELRPAAVTSNFGLGAICVAVVAIGGVVLLEYTEPASPLSVCVRSRPASASAARQGVGTGAAALSAAGRAEEGAGAMTSAEAAPVLSGLPGHTHDHTDAPWRVVQGATSVALSPAAYFRRRRNNWTAGKGRYVGKGSGDGGGSGGATSSGGLGHMAKGASERLSAMLPQLDTSELARGKNTTALLWILCGVVAYYGVTITVYVVAVLSMGYPAWDSNQIHSPDVIPTYLFLVLGPSTLVAFVLTRSYSVYYQSSEPLKGDTPASVHCGVRVLRMLGDSKVTFRDPVMVYLCDVYLQLVALLCGLVTLLLVCEWSFLFSFRHAVPFINPDSWAYRFRVVTVLGFSLPLCLSALYKSWAWPWDSVDIEDYDAFMDIQCLPPPDEVLQSLTGNQDVTGSADSAKQLGLAVRLGAQEDVEAEVRRMASRHPAAREVAAT